MKKHRKTWSEQEKLTIVKFYQEKGLSATSREFEVSSPTILNWFRSYTSSGEQGLSKGHKTDKDKEIKRLIKENQALKEIVAERELALRIKDALLKKSL